MRPKIVVGIHSASMINPHWKVLRPSIALPDVDVLVNVYPRVNLGENSGGGYGITKNFDVIISQQFEGWLHSNTDALTVSLDPKDVKILQWREKKLQALILNRMFQDNPELQDRTSYRLVKTFVKDTLEYTKSGTYSKNQELEKPSDLKSVCLASEDSNDIDSVFIGAVSIDAEVVQYFGNTEWLVVKPINGAKGQSQFKVRRDRFYDVMISDDGNRVENREFIKFSKDWFGPTYLIDNQHERIKDTKEVQTELGTEVRPASFNPRAKWLIQEHVENIEREFRVIHGGNKFWIRERTIDDGEYRQANLTYPKSLDDAELMKYRRANNTDPLDNRIVKMAMMLAKQTNQYLHSIDFFLTKDGQLGIFEFGCHFGIDLTDPNFACEVWEAFIVDTAMRWAVDSGHYVPKEKSAYEKACEGGFCGSPELWHDAMKWGSAGDYSTAVTAGYRGTESKWVELQGIYRCNWSK